MTSLHCLDSNCLTLRNPTMSDMPGSWSLYEDIMRAEHPIAYAKMKDRSTFKLIIVKKKKDQFPVYLVVYLSHLLKVK